MRYLIFFLTVRIIKCPVVNDFVSCGTTAQIEPSPPHRWHTCRAEVILTSDQLVDEAAAYITYNKHKRQTSMPSAGLEPAIPAIKWPQPFTSDRGATGIAMVNESEQ